MLAVRNPRLRSQVSEFTAEICRKVLSLVLATKERWESQVAKMKAAGVVQEGDHEVSYEEMKAFQDKGDYDM
jgi:hypothetical protein